MAELVADASPEKRLFISLLTRDISLVDAVLDIVDNSINAALEPYAERLNTAREYEELLLSDAVEPSCHIEITFGGDALEVRDDALGIRTDAARDEIFKFGRSSKGQEKNDRLSVYGIGLKRAVFKIDRYFHMISDHAEGGFKLDLDVDSWAELPQVKWEFPIESRPPSSKTGTIVRVTGFREDIARRLADGVFQKQLREKIAQVYTIFVGRVVTISVNGDPVEGLAFGVPPQQSESDSPERCHFSARDLPSHTR